jgi:hypothetical protein
MNPLDDDAPLLDRYRACRLGFSLAALACGMMAFHASGFTAFYLTADHKYRLFFSQDDWLLFATSVITWSGLAGAVVLGRCWSLPGWRRQTALLVVLSILAAAVWVARHAVRFGLAAEPLPYVELLVRLALGPRWIWLALLCGLAADVASHLGAPNVRPLRASALATITAGVAFWVMMLLIEIIPFALGAGPVGRRVMVGIWLQLVGFWGFSTAAAFTTTLLLLVAARECTRLIRELKRAEVHAFETADAAPVP